MTNRYAKLPYIVCFALALSSCSPLIQPTTYQVPSFKQQGDGQVDANLGYGGLNFQLAYSPLNKLAVAGTAVVFDHTGNNPGYSKHYTFGAGFYTPLEDSVNVFSIYVKYGYGHSVDNSTNTDANNNMVVQSTTGIYFNEVQVQPQLQKQFKNGSFYMGLRVTRLFTYAFTSNDKLRESPDVTGTIEPFLGYDVGFKHLRVSMQAGIYSHGDTHIDDGSQTFLIFNTTPSDGALNVSLGLTYSFNLNKRRFNPLK